MFKPIAIDNLVWSKNRECEIVWRDPIMSSSEISLAFKSVSKVFGPAPAKALSAFAAGQSREQIRAELGATIALYNVSLEIEKSTLSVVMGLSGSGKSTLLRLANRLIEADAGRVIVKGQNIHELDGSALQNLRRKTISMVFQDFALFPHKTVAQNIGYGLTVRKEDAKQIKNTVDYWIEKMGLASFGAAYPFELSGGMKQRVGLARALASDPDILAMDEPFSALDPLIRSEMQDLLLELQSDLKKTIFFITHDMREAVKLADQITILKDGQLIQSATPEKIISSPADEYIAAFTSDLNA